MTHNPYASAPLGYFDLSTLGPLGISELMPGVHNLLDYAAIKPGEVILLLVEHSTDPVVVQALSAGAAHRGGIVHVLSVPPLSPGGCDPEVPSPLVLQAFGAADVVIECTWWPSQHSRRMFFTELAKFSTRMLALTQTATAAALITAARLPMELFLAILRATQDRVLDAKSLRLTTDRGTDLTFSDVHFTPDEARPLGPGEWRPVPLGGLNFHPRNTNGVMVIEDSTVTGVPEAPVRVELRDNLVTGIEGGVSAERLQRFAPGGYYMRHANLGLNPKARHAGGAQIEREKRAGTFYLGIDGLVDGHADPTSAGLAHCDCEFERPTLTADGKVIIDDGHLTILDDPQVREVAARFGPPEILLDSNPALILPARYSGGPFSS